MNISSIFSALASFKRSTIDAAKSIIVTVRNLYGHLPGDVQHSKAVEMLMQGVPNLEKWAAHAIIGATFGWVQQHWPASLQPISGTIKDDLLAAADKAIDTGNAELLKPSPFSIADSQLGTGTGALPAADPQPSPLVPLGESQPPPAAPPQILQPHAPVG